MNIEYCFSSQLLESSLNLQLEENSLRSVDRFYNSGRVWRSCLAPADRGWWRGDTSHQCPSSADRCPRIDSEDSTIVACFWLIPIVTQQNSQYHPERKFRYASILLNSSIKFVTCNECVNSQGYCIIIRMTLTWHPPSQWLT